MAGGTSTCDTSIEKLPRPCRRRLEDGHRVRGRRGLEADPEEDDAPLRVVACDAERVERRVHDAHVGSPALQGEEVAVRPRHAQHVPERREDHVRVARDRVRAVDHLERA